jgi:branched-chain amino acid transport system permease protein
VDAYLPFFLNGLAQGMLLFLIAVGLSLIFGVLGVLNFAHGAFYMLGAYVTFQLTSRLDIDFWLAVLLAPLAVGALGGITEVVFLRRMYLRPTADQLLLTFAFVLILDDAVRVVWGSGARTVLQPALLAGSVPIGERLFPTYNLAVAALAPLVGIALWLALTRSTFGRMVRAAAQDREMAAALGLHVPRIFTSVFVAGIALAALGGTLAAPLRTLSPGMGDAIIIDSFIVAVVGGLGSFPGALVGALLLGQIGAFGVVHPAVAQVQTALPFILMAAILLVRPRGLFG